MPFCLCSRSQFNGTATKSQSTKMSIKLNLDAFVRRQKTHFATKNVAKWKQLYRHFHSLVQVFVTISICNIVVGWHSCSCLNMFFSVQAPPSEDGERRAWKKKRKHLNKDGSVTMRLPNRNNCSTNGRLHCISFMFGCSLPPSCSLRIVLTK